MRDEPLPRPPPGHYLARMATKDQTSLIRDLLDPDLDTAEVARRHHAGPEDLRAAVRSPAFRAAAAAMREVDEARTAALLPAQQARAVQRLARIAAQPAETTAQAESARRAATALIRCKAPTNPEQDASSLPTHSHPSPERDASTLPSSPLSSPKATTLPRDPTLTLALLAALAADKPAHPKQPGSPRRPATPAELFARLGTG